MYDDEAKTSFKNIVCGYKEFQHTGFSVTITLQYEGGGFQLKSCMRLKSHFEQIQFRCNLAQDAKL